MFGGGGGTRLFMNVPTGGDVNMRVNNVNVLFYNSTGLAVTGALSSTTGANFATSSGSVGIGTASPAAPLHIAFGSAVNDAELRIQQTTNGTASQITIAANNDGGAIYNFIRSVTTSGTEHWRIGGGAAASTMAFSTGGTERARIDSVGNVGIGSTSPNAILVLQGVGRVGDVNGNRNTLYLKNSNSSSNQSNFISFGSAGTAVGCFIGNDLNADGTTVNQLNIQAGASGGIFLANGGNSWTGLSDERFKDIIEPITDAANKVSLLRAVIGKYKTDAEGTRRSFIIAQDVQAVLPEAVNVGTDEQKTLGVSYTDVIPLLVASIKELTQRVAALESK
jgi:hypothetical protein